MAILLSLGIPIAQACQGQVLPVCVASSRDDASWAAVPIRLQGTVMEPIVLAGEDWVQQILLLLGKHPPQLTLLAWSGETSRWRYLAGRALDTLIRHAPCDVAVVRTPASPQVFARRIQTLQRILVGWGGGPNSILGVQLGLQLNATARVTAMSVLQQDAGPTARLALEQSFQESLAEWADEERLDLQVCTASHVVEGLLREAAQGYDLVIIGATSEGFVDRFLFGNLTQRIAASATLPLLIVRKLRTDQVTAADIAQPMVGIRRLPARDQARVYQQVRRAARGDGDYRVMTILAAAVATLGLLLSNAAVIIGGMIIAPLMSPLLGLALGIVQGDRRLIRTAIRATLLGILLAVLTSLVFGMLVPNHQVTAEMLVRGNPSLLDLAVALVAGVTAAYANARRDAASALPGVAIAVALVPPLATVGLALESGDTRVALGALLLFVTNLVAIVAAATVTFAVIGFSPIRGSTVSTLTFGSGLIGTLIALASLVVVLGPVTVQSFQEASLRRSIQSALQTQVPAIGHGVFLSNWRLARRSGQTLYLEVEVKAEDGISYDSVVGLQERVATQLQRPVALVLSLIPVTQLDPLVPPTFTPTAVPSPTFTMTPRAPTPTPLPTSTATPRPTPSATIAATRTPTPSATVTMTPSSTLTPTVDITTTVGLTSTSTLSATMWISQTVSPPLTSAPTISVMHTLSLTSVPLSTPPSKP